MKMSQASEDYSVSSNMFKEKLQQVTVVWKRKQMGKIFFWRGNRVAVLFFKHLL